ncbi:MAG: ThuA domain-containing protein [Deltaproteobacteria bacterium]|nr:ThuA domain-containing protein [Deltaproteobacteria bacterium]MBW2394976.1 ThuA domain-containing protein [Deltaproteobacteria bacterium]
MIRPRALMASALVAILLSGCGVWRAIFPKFEYETEPPTLPADLGSPAILVFTKTNGFRHEEAIPAGVALIEDIASRRGWSTFHTENGAVFTPELLDRFDVVVWHMTSGDVLNEEQRQAFRSWLEAGHGFVGTHAAGDGSHTWPWYRKTIIGVDYGEHPLGPQFQEATAIVEDRDHPATAKLPESFNHMEEWYSFTESPRTKGFRVLARVDESTYSPQIDFLWMDKDLRMGDDHPIVWTTCAGKGRVLYNALGHQAAAYETQELKDLTEGSLVWALGLDGPACP